MMSVPASLKLHAQLRGKVVENLPDGGIIMSFEGRLLRVQNETSRPLHVGQIVSVIVKAIEPMRLQVIADRQEQRRRGRIDVSV